MRTKTTAPPHPQATAVHRGTQHKMPLAFSELGLDRLWRVPVTGDQARAVHVWQGRKGVEDAWMDPVGQAHATTPDDPYLNWQWGLDNVGTWNSSAVAGADIQALDAWDLETGDGVVIAVLDSGVNLNEPDISGRLWVNSGEKEDKTDTDGNGYADDINGWDFANEDAEPSDENGHGSNVAGIAAAESNNGEAYAGMCWNCEVMPLQVLQDDWGYYSWWSEAVVYAVDNGAQVINMSLGGTTPDASLCESLAYAEAAEVAVMVSAGNGDTDEEYWPSVCETAIAVAATDPADERASPFCWGGGSSFGDHIFISAPGEEIYGLSPSTLDYSWYWCGTSQATPLVTGVAALLLSMEPDLSVAEIETYLVDGSEDEVGRKDEDTPGWDQYHGWGRLNAYQSLLLLSDDIADVDGDGVNLREGDCDDNDPAIYPGADEVCDDLDSDCDGSLVDAWADADEDGEPDCIEDIDEDGWTEVDGDCDDQDSEVSPDNEEVAYDGRDNDCDETTSDDDLDGDGFGIAVDCDDEDDQISPAAEEVCDGVDNDCSDEADDHPVDGVVMYVDADGDGLGDETSSVYTCGGDEWVDQAGDCDDTDPGVLGETVWFADEDGDGLGAGGNAEASCVAPDGYVSNADDCDDTVDGDACDSEDKGGCSVVAAPTGLFWGLMPLLWARMRGRRDHLR